MKDTVHASREDVKNRLLARVFGTAAVYLGAAILVIAACDTLVGLPGLPGFWYVNRTLWIGLGLFLIPAGVILQAWHLQEPPEWKPTRPGPRFRQVRVYSRDGCHLCDEAVEILEGPAYAEYFPAVEIVDIAGDSRLESQFGLSIPIVEIDGRIRFKGRISEVLLRRLIEGTSPT